MELQQDPTVFISGASGTDTLQLKQTEEGCEMWLKALEKVVLEYFHKEEKN